MVLSRAALDVVRRELPAHPAVLTMHPILDEQRLTPKTSRPSVVVAGQYKPARDLELLAQLGPRLRDAGWTTTIVGRGWPPVPGWDVDDRFVPEDELDDLLGAAWALLLPYREYFQSGVAVRALENGTPTVGESTSFLDDLQPAHERLRVPVGACAEAWLEALSHVTDDPVGGTGGLRRLPRASAEVVGRRVRRPDLTTRRCGRASSAPVRRHVVAQLAVVLARGVPGRLGGGSRIAARHRVGQTRRPPGRRTTRRGDPAASTTGGAPGAAPRLRTVPRRARAASRGTTSAAVDVVAAGSARHLAACAARRGRARLGDAVRRRRRGR